jgi:hypothetical protein
MNGGHFQIARILLTFIFERAFFLTDSNIYARGIAFFVTHDIISHNFLHRLNMLNYNLIIEFYIKNIVICQ